MFVIALDSGTVTAESVSWCGRRHDDAEPNASAGTTLVELFDAVFHALHYGEQVAVGVDAPLVAPLVGAPDDEAVLAAAQVTPAEPGLAAMVQLLDGLGQWRPWTAVSTSIPGWRATRSILVWQFGGGGPSAAVEALFDLVAAGRPDALAPAVAAVPVVNLVAAAAIGSGLSVDRAELTRPVLRLELGVG